MIKPDWLLQESLVKPGKSFNPEPLKQLAKKKVKKAIRNRIKN